MDGKLHHQTTKTGLTQSQTCLTFTAQLQHQITQIMCLIILSKLVLGPQLLFSKTLFSSNKVECDISSAGCGFPGNREWSVREGHIYEEVSFRSSLRSSAVVYLSLLCICTGMEYFCHFFLVRVFRILLNVNCWLWEIFSSVHKEKKTQICCETVCVWRFEITKEIRIFFIYLLKIHAMSHFLNYFEEKYIHCSKWAL